MRGYCESCAEEVDSVVDEQAGDVCPHCGDDVHPGVHVEGDIGWVCGTPEEEEYADVDFDEWLLAQE